MTAPIYDGYTAPVEKRCVRCGGIVKSELYALCDNCREADRIDGWLNAMAKWLEENCKQEVDRRAESDFARYGY